MSFVESFEDLLEKSQSILLTGRSIYSALNERMTIPLSFRPSGSPTLRQDFTRASRCTYRTCAVNRPFSLILGGVQQDRITFLENSLKHLYDLSLFQKILYRKNNDLIVYLDILNFSSKFKIKIKM